ncbi:MAG: type II secretion system protein [Planctomycetota bacterium]
MKKKAEFNAQALKPTHKAFTLVELLVVIAIISILAGMLLPALENAISSAHAISCNNLLKQHSMANSIYQTDYDGYFFAYGNSQEGWHVLSSMAENGEDVFKCPGAEEWSDFDYSNGWVQYGYSTRLARTYVGAGLDLPVPKITSIKNPSNTVLFGDSQGRFSSNGDHAFAWIIDWSEDRWFDVRHNGNANINWVDGHNENKDWETRAYATAIGVPASVIYYWQQ